MLPYLQKLLYLRWCESPWPGVLTDRSEIMHQLARPSPTQINETHGYLTLQGLTDQRHPALYFLKVILALNLIVDFGLRFGDLSDTFIRYSRGVCLFSTPGTGNPCAISVGLSAECSFSTSPITTLFSRRCAANCAAWGGLNTSCLIHEIGKTVMITTKNMERTEIKDSRRTLGAFLYC